MSGEYHKWWSPALGQDMELKVYGQSGKPILVFPSGGGRFYEYEDFGMVEACRPFLDAGRAQLFTVDSVDYQSWFNRSASPAERVRRHEQYERYVMSEVVPFIRKRTGPRTIMTTGSSGGAYHAANFLFRHPDTFDAVIGLSGLYGPRFAFGDHWDNVLYFHFPLAYLPRLEDPAILAKIRRCRIVLCVGQGEWERCDQYDCVAETRAMKELLDAKRIPCWVDFWGHDVNHDWVWWRKQIAYFLERVL